MRAALLLVPALLSAQHEHMDMTAMRPRFSVAASVIPVLTRATPTAEQRSLTEAYLAQPMLNAAWTSAHASLVTMLDAEGLTMRGGELATGMSGEGFIDRRHPHTYLHEIVADAAWRAPSTAATNVAVSVGKGFVPFGSDDPMLRPSIKYPINHHLAQILERAFVSVGARYGFLTLEAATFNGDEPTSASSNPTLRNFGDSWSARLIARNDELQLSASYAFVKSPENPEGQSLDQRKRHVGVQWSTSLLGAPFTAFGEWARSTEQSHTGVVPILVSWLGEARWRVPTLDVETAIRVERSDRAEEARSSTDPFRIPLPVTDHSLLGITPWTVVTATLARPIQRDRFQVAPFVEASLSQPRSQMLGPFDPAAYYGSTHLWMLSAGARLATGDGHRGMGYYGVRRDDMTHRH